jgi:hypothetical protein
MRALTAAALLAPLAAPLVAPLAAQAQPSLTPKRDYAATYTIDGAGPMNGEMRIAFSTALGIQRMEGGPMGMVMLMDPAKGSLTMIDAGNRRYMELTGGRSSAPWTDTERYRFERAGADRVAGIPCTTWRMLENNQPRGTACATDDGIMLRSEWQREGSRGSITATTVSITPQRAEDFRVPAGFTRMEMPTFGGPPPRRQ